MGNLIQGFQLCEQSPRAPQPPSKVTLVPSQLAMLHRCIKIEGLRKGIGVMADLPGSGKSYVVLSLVLLDSKSTNILVVPQNIHGQWAQAINVFCNIRWASYVSYEDVSGLYFNKKGLYEKQLILTTPLYFDVICAALDGHKVDRVFIDEIDSVEFMVRRRPNAFLWLVSASFDNNSLERLGLKLDDQAIASVTCRCKEDFVRSSFPLPEPVTTTLVCKNVYIDHILHGMVTEEEYAAINALDFSAMKKRFNTRTALNEKEALQYLVGDLADTVAHCTTSIEDLERSLDMCVTEMERKAVIAQIEDKKKTLSKAEERLQCIRERIVDNSMCLICYDDVTSKTVTGCCKQVYCYRCITSWLERKETCPYCRTLGFEIVTIEEGAAPAPKPPPKLESSQKTKMEAFKGLFENGLGSKVIVFSDYRKIFKQVGDVLDELDISHIELDGGSIGAIDRDVAAYKTGDARVLMTNSSLYGCGMNLENTTDIVLMHRTRDKMYEQVVGRAQRPGRTAPLRIWRLFHENEMAHWQPSAMHPSQAWTLTSWLP